MEYLNIASGSVAAAATPASLNSPPDVLVNRNRLTERLPSAAAVAVDAEPPSIRIFAELAQIELNTLPPPFTFQLIALPLFRPIVVALKTENTV